jgi:sugar lactone lactonase YvrE
MKTFSVIILWFVFGFSVQQTKAQIITTIAGNGAGSPSSGGYSGDGGQATNAELYYPYGLTIDALGNIYIADDVNNRVRKITTSGTISTIAGSGSIGLVSGGYSGDGGQATAAEFYEISSVAVDNIGNVYISDFGNYCIRKVNTSGIISTIVNTDTTNGFSGDGGQATAAKMSSATGICVDASGNLYFADTFNNRVRMVNTAGIINTVAGSSTQGFSGDGGQATDAELDTPYSVSVDALGNLYISDSYNNRIRKVNTNGIITTVAGIGTMTYSGDGGQATNAGIYSPFGVAIDSEGNLYIADTGNQRIRKVNTSGIITTIAGDGYGAGGAGGYSGDGGQATAAELYAPQGVILDAAGNLYFADNVNNRIRKVSNATSLGIEQFHNNIQVTVYPNPASQVLNITFTKNTESSNTIKLVNLIGQTIYSNVIDKSEVIDISGFTKGIYMLVVTDDNNTVTKKIIIE